ncbi:hypothetical protein EI42_01675 [Thermosporothrix hazakensis]|jgi:hypothetical protein|uniref:PrgI family protein n=2 Tax=Thermosporothrix TaxID=768650 RepID=A0A326UJ82_THEHA|nr:PrgI family protein [Thermosporothrix hazakensis]PZW32583.1 hypothetical protein EI42_01675 [Thermosporothrix hazakensis]BBH87486.1 hypothetical protein KTC_22370 [Thermosporothrix sp. COM3]GCE49937.1 hypothetical protein KTH_48060 [Thermosporothrix hazakensis]
MKKEEFPTFLNEQPTIIFGRTGRELLIIVCGVVGGYSLWVNCSELLPDLWWMITCAILAGLVVLLSLIIALLPIAERPMEEWFMCWLLFVSMPRLYLYRPSEDVAEDEKPSKAKKKSPKQQPNEEEDFLE